MFSETLRSGRVLAQSTLLVAFVVTGAGSVEAQTSGTLGGFTASATDAGLRPPLSAGEIGTFLPSRGPFVFPSPYGTAGVRLTNGSDCGNADCVIPVGYSYWSNINNHVGSDTMLVFLGLERNKGGAGPTLFSYDKRTGETRNAGALFAPDSPYSWSTGEGWYFSATQPTSLYMNDGPRMLRYDVLAHTIQTVYDVRDQLGSDRYIWQMHSSNDDRVHSATVRHAGTYAMLGCVAYREDTRQTLYFPAKGSYDECQVDKSGRWLIIKENVDGRNGEDNRIIDLQTGAEQIFLDEDGAAGHSDVGYGYLVAEDNFAPQPGAVRVWQLGTDMNAGGQGRLIYSLASWSSGLGHIAFGDAQPGTPIDQQMVCSSNASRTNLPRVNEIVCYLANGSLDVLVVAPNMTDLNASGGGGDDYWKLPKGNLDVTGEYFIWTANAGTSRNDAFIVRIPKERLGASAPPTPAPVTDPGPSPVTSSTPISDPVPVQAADGDTTSPIAAPPVAEGVEWMSLVNVTASGSTLQKSSGCSGCPDAVAMSAQELISDGEVQFTVSDANALRYVGLSTGSLGAGPADTMFALRLQAGTAEVRESGGYRSETSIAGGDTLTIAVSGGVVTYRRNGTPFYTSSLQNTSALRVSAFFYDVGATIENVQITTTR